MKNNSVTELDLRYFPKTYALLEVDPEDNWKCNPPRCQGIMSECTRHLQFGNDILHFCTLGQTVPIKEFKWPSWKSQTNVRAVGQSVYAETVLR